MNKLINYKCNIIYTCFSRGIWSPIILLLMQNGCYQCLEEKLLFNPLALTMHGMRYIYILTGNDWHCILFLFKIKSLKVADIIRGGLRRFSDSLGQLWNSLADFFIRSGHFEKVRHLFIPTLWSQGAKKMNFWACFSPIP